MSALLTIAENASEVTASPVTFGHLITLVVGLVTTVGGSIFGGARWFGRHVDRLGEERAKERDRDAALIDLHASERTKERAAFLASLDSRDSRFTQALAHQEAECARARDADRQQRADELRIILRVAGIPYPGDSGKFKTPATERAKEPPT